MRCQKCGDDKHENEFQLRTDTGKRRNVCRLCRTKRDSTARRQHYQRDPQKHAEVKKHCRESAAERGKRLRLAAISHYSQGTMRCACCGEPELAFLTLDHINNDGAEHRRQLFGKKSRSYSTRALYSVLAKQGYPVGLQVLCWNCNCAKDILGYCPHQKRRAPDGVGSLWAGSVIQQDRDRTATTGEPAMKNTLELASSDVALDDEFGKFLGNLTYWLGESTAAIDKVVVKPISPTRADVDLYDTSEEEGNQELIIGNYAEPGMVVEWVGEFRGRPMVEINGVLFEARGRHVAGWIVGYE